MKTLIFLLALMVKLSVAQSFDIQDASVQVNPELKQLVFSIEVAGLAGDSVPTMVGSLDGAPVLGYVFPTNLNTSDVGFDDTEGILALALTSHPDFDDTPLWDENNDAIYDNDGIVWHAHWVVLTEDTRVAGNLSVKATVEASVLPPTNPNMPMYMDSPGFQVVWEGSTIECTVPLYRINQKTDFKFDAVAARMTVNTSDETLPMLGVYEVYDVLSGDLSLPYQTQYYSPDTLFMSASLTGTERLQEAALVKVFPNPASRLLQFELPNNTSSYHAQLTTIGGQLVGNFTLNSSQNTINLEQLPIGKGVYTLQLLNESSKVLSQKKIVIQ